MRLDYQRNLLPNTAALDRMPKKPAAENTKKAAGNAKKAAHAAAKAEVEAQKRAAVDDADWAKGAKSSMKKEAEAEKKAEAARKKAEKEALLKAEMESIKNAKPSASKDKSTKLKVPIPRRGIDTALSNVGEEGSSVLPTLVASGIDDALDALDITTGTHGTEVDRHPERRVKAAYAAFEERRLPELRAEHPGLRLAQMKEILRKEFDKSPENPMNQSRNVSYDATKNEIATKRATERASVENRLAASSRK